MICGTYSLLKLFGFTIVIALLVRERKEGKRKWGEREREKGDRVGVGGVGSNINGGGERKVARENELT